MKPLLATATASLAVLLGGCASVVGDVRPFEPMAPGADYVDTSELPAPVAAGGSIYAGAGGMRLFEDNRARTVGDLLTIVLVESTTARTNATTAVSKDSSIAMGAPTIAGRGVTYNGQPILQAEIEGSRGFDGSGNSAQSNQLFGDVTVQVIRDLGRGNLLVGGEKMVRLNQGDELIQIQGIVRAADIGSDNRVTSDRVGNARIVYGGRGTLARSNAMGWLGRFFNSAAFPH